MQAGELIVTSKDQVRIALHKFPYDVKVRFRDDDWLVPCNTHHCDMLEWEVLPNYHCGGYELVISWDIGNVREITWRVYY